MKDRSPNLVDVVSVVDFLQTEATQKQRDRMLDFGIDNDRILGVPKSPIRFAAKLIGTQHDLAMDLWDSGYHETRLLAVLVADPEKFSFTLATKWADELWSWGICDQMARYLLPKLDFAHRLISYCFQQQDIFTRRLAFAGLACEIQKSPQKLDEHLDFYRHIIEAGAKDPDCAKPLISKALLWALLEMGKSGEHGQEIAIEIAAELAEGDKLEASIGRRALKNLENLIAVPERRRLISNTSKTAKRNT